MQIVIYDSSGQTWDGTQFTAVYTRVDATLTGSGTNRDWSYDFAATADGSYIFAAFASDAAGNTDPTTDWRSFTVSSDTGAPDSVTNTPLNGETVSAPVMLSGTATDDVEVDRVQIVIYDSQTHTWDGTQFTAIYTRVDATLTGSGATRDWSYDFAAPADGSYTFAAFASDAAENTDPTADWRSFTVSSDTGAPGVSLTTPTNGQAIASPATLSGTATDDTGVANVELEIYNDQSQTWDGATFTSAPTHVDAILTNPGGTNTDWSYDANLPFGTYEFRATAVDAVGNSTDSSLRTFSVSTTFFVGEVDDGVLVQDDATGTGYLMFSATPVHNRFGDLNSGNSEHLVAVRFSNGFWEYNNNSNWQTFVPEAVDRLLASVDFTADTVMSLEGTAGDVFGIPQGYSNGDLVFFADQSNGFGNDGEFDFEGTFFEVAP